MTRSDRRANAAKTEAPSRTRATMGIIVGFTAIAVLIGAGLAIWTTVAGDPFAAIVQQAAAAEEDQPQPKPDRETEEPTPEESSPSPLPSSTPTPTETVPVEPVPVDPPPPVRPEGSVALTDEVWVAGGSFRIAEMQRVDVAGADGAPLGKALRVTVSFSNGSPAGIELTSTTVTATVGADRTAVPQLSTPATVPYLGWVEAGSVTQAQYFFPIDEAQQRDMSVTVTYGEGQVVTYWGDAGQVFPGLVTPEPPATPVVPEPTVPEPTDPPTAPEPQDAPVVSEPTEE